MKEERYFFHRTEKRGILEEKNVLYPESKVEWAATIQMIASKVKNIFNHRLLTSHMLMYLSTRIRLRYILVIHPLQTFSCLSTSFLAGQKNQER